VDRLKPGRETPQARSQSRLQAGRINRASIDRADEEVSETQSRYRCRGIDADKFSNRDATPYSLWQ
jgi:hypothetical protein